MDERDKRHRRQFEPPPWERQAFDEFERLRGEREQEAALDAAILAAKAPADATRVEAPQEAIAPQGAAALVEEVLAQAPQVAAGSVGQGAVGEDPGVRGISNAAFDTMLIGLKSEEPPVGKDHKIIANTVAGALAVFGIWFVVWAAVLLSKAGADAGLGPTAASFLLAVWGLMLVGGAALLIKKFNFS